MPREPSSSDEFVAFFGMYLNLEAWNTHCREGIPFSFRWNTSQTGIVSDKKCCQLLEFIGSKLLYPGFQQDFQIRSLPACYYIWTGRKTTTEFLWKCDSGSVTKETLPEMYLKPPRTDLDQAIKWRRPSIRRRHLCLISVCWCFKVVRQGTCPHDSF